MTHLLVSICVFSQSELKTLIQGTSVSNREGPARTKPLIPEMCFAGSSDGQLSTPNLDEGGTSPLVSCSTCCVRVHTSECRRRLHQFITIILHALLFWSNPLRVMLLEENNQRRLGVLKQK